MNSLSWRQIVLLVVGAAAPLTGMLGAVPPAISLGNGAGVPGAYVIAGIILLLFSVGFAAMSRHVVNAGAFYAYVAQGLGRPCGIGAAFIAVVAYTAIQIALYGLLGFFCSDIIGGRIGLAIPWFVYGLIAMAVIQFLGLRNVETNSRVIGVFMVLETAILIVLSIAIVAAGGGPEGLSARPFAFSNVFSGQLGIAIMFAMASFIGFEATAIYGAESIDPRRDVPLATYVSVSAIMVFFAFVTWAIVCAYGPAKVMDAATNDAANFWFAQSDRYLSSTATTVMSLLLLSSIFASMLAFHSAITRYLHALAVDGLLPRQLAAMHPRFASPHVASYVQTASAAIVLVVFIGAGADPYTLIFNWMAAFGSIGIIALQALVSLSVIAYFRRNRRDTRIWNTLVAPALGGLGLLYALGLLIANLPVLSGSDSPVVNMLPWTMLAVFVAGLAAVWSMRRSRPGRYARFAGLSDQSLLPAESET